MGVPKTMTEGQLGNQERKYAWKYALGNAAGSEGNGCRLVSATVWAPRHHHLSLELQQNSPNLSLFYFPPDYQFPSQKPECCFEMLHELTHPLKILQSLPITCGRKPQTLPRPMKAGMIWLQDASKSSSATVLKFHNCGEIFHTVLSKSVILPPPSHPSLSILTLYVPFVTT